MNTYEKQVRNDTFLSGGLIAIGMAWVALAALQALAGSGYAGDTARGASATVLDAQHAATGALAAGSKAS
jgi:hypothetical protein